MQKTTSHKRDYRRAAKFGLVGIANTALDFAIFNAITKFYFSANGMPTTGQLLIANTISTTAAMFFSFLVNRKVVFKPQGGSAVKQVILFYAVTAVGLYVVQNGIIHFLTDTWTQPLQIALHIVRSLGIAWPSDGFYINNGAKAVGTVASLAWNYYLYKRVVFK